MEVDDVARAHEADELVGVSGEGVLVDGALPLPELPAVARSTVEVVVDPLRDPEELDVPVIVTQRTSTPAPRAYASSDCSISATPPPRAVEFTCQTTRPARTRLALAIARSTRAYSSPSSALNRSGGAGPTGTWLIAATIADSSLPSRSSPSSPMLILLLAATGTALATGLGAIPVFLLGERAAALQPLLLGIAAGTMAVASVVGLILPGLDEGSASSVATGSGPACCF